MSEEIPTKNPEKKETVKDNARKFIVDAVDLNFLKEHNATAVDLVVDWFETGEENEQKVVYKQFDTGNIQILLISKVTKDGDRVAVKEEITEEKYKSLIEPSMPHLEKTRYEFKSIQDGTVFNLKYDVFSDGAFHILEVDSETGDSKSQFDLSDFPGAIEITEDKRYEGYRITEIM